MGKELDKRQPRHFLSKQLKNKSKNYDIFKYLDSLAKPISIFSVLTLYE